MSGIGPKKEYVYRYQVPPKDVDLDEESARKRYESLVSIRDAVVLITAECHISEREDGTYCEKHGRKVSFGAVRCDYLANRFSEGQEVEPKKQVQQYVNEILGIRNPNTVRRLTGI